MVTNNCLSDKELIEKIKKESSSDAFEILRERHGGLFVKIVKRYTPGFLRISGVCYQDVIESRTKILYDSVLSYDSDKEVQFNTWFGNQVDFFCKNTLNKNKNNKFVTANPEEMETFMDNILFYIPELGYEEEAKQIFEVLNRHSDSRLAKVFYMKFYLPKPDNSFNNIGKEMQLSRQGVINLYRKALSYLEENKTLLKKIKTK